MTRDETYRAQAASFGAAAAEYERGRPPYPPRALDWLVPAGAVRVADIGAGTGKLSRQLLGRGLAVIAVEPLAGMREQLRRTVPEAAVVAGTAEQIPLADHTVDAVLLAQAWHWVEPARAVPEVARVLAPGGRLGLLWNFRDERDAVSAQLSTIMGSRESAGPAICGLEPEVGPPFGPLERFEVGWVYRLSPAALVDYVASRSYVITKPEPQRAAMLDDVRRLLVTHPALAGSGLVSLPQLTRCYRANLPA
jgi:SAM-dependent methyltransferase